MRGTNERILLQFLLSSFFFFSSRRRHTRSDRDWSSDVCSSDLVNNVGLARHERVDAVDPDVFAMVMDLNVRPALQLTQALLPGMRAAGFGRIKIGRASCRERV